MPSCNNFSELAQGFTIKGLYGTTLSEEFALLVSQRGLPATVYVSEGVVDAWNGVDASAEIQAFHDSVPASVQQVWATAPYTAGGTPQFDLANQLLELMNATVLPFGGKDCAGPDPNPNTYDGIHLTNSADFAACITG